MSHLKAAVLQLHLFLVNQLLNISQVQQRMIEEWRKGRSRGGGETADDGEEDIYGTEANGSRLSDDSDGETNKVLETADGPKQFISHVPVPSQQDIEEAIVRRKKMELLQKYASDTLRAEAAEAKALLGI